MIEEPSTLLLEEEFDIEYIGEGAANVVFRLVRSAAPRVVLHSRNVPSTSSRTNGSHRPSDVHLPLLRLRKDLSTVTSIVDAHNNYQRMILPHLDPMGLVESTLAVLPSHLLARCNARLLDMDELGIRPKKRRSGYLADQPYANFVQDMSPRGPSDTVIEFKPKWLSQSPSAPQNSKRCRTCALRAMRHDKTPDTSLEDAFCPLDLANQDLSFVKAVLTKHLRQHWRPLRTDARISVIADAVAEHLVQSQVIEKIKRLQMRMDPHGILNSKVDDRLLMAMTLRDCTMFIRVGEDDEVEARLGDIDLKPATKSSYWRLTEERLRDEGWYTCEEGDGSEKDSICALSR